jgi:hypothetical protein
MATHDDKKTSIEHRESIEGKKLEAPATANVNLLDDDGNVRRIPVPSTDPNGQMAQAGSYRHLLLVLDLLPSASRRRWPHLAFLHRRIRALGIWR